MSFVDQSAVSNGPERHCEELLGSLLKAFPPTELGTHERAGYTYQGKPCLTAQAYNPDFCVPGDMKMDPENFGPIKEATLGLIQSALNCSYGVSMDEIREEASNAIKYNLWRAIDADLVADLAAEAVAQPAAPNALCALAAAGQFLASTGVCGNGVIVGSVGWFLQLGKDHLVFNGEYFTNTIGNIVIPLSVNTPTVYAFDSAVDIRVAMDLQFLDETMPGQRVRNDRIVRAEQIYTVAFDACNVGSFDVAPCA